MTAIGTQIYGIEKELTADFEGTIRQIRALGFDTIEPLLFLSGTQKDHTLNFWTMETLLRAKEVMDQVGLRLPSVHLMDLISSPKDQTPGQLADVLRDVAAKTGITVFVLSGLISSRIQAMEWADLLRPLTEQLAREGIGILYHNHDAEFRSNGAGDCLDALLESVPLLDLEFDTGWAAVTTDEVAVFEHFRDRIRTLHLKDEYTEFLRSGYAKDTIPMAAFSPIGYGGVRHRQILSRLEGMAHFGGDLIIDQDSGRTSMMDELSLGLGFIRSCL